MKKIDSTENENTLGDFIWVHVRGFLLLILTLVGIFSTFNMAIHFIDEINKTDIESIRYCPHCGQDLLFKG